MDYTIAIGIDSYLELDNTPFAENDAREFNCTMVNTFNCEENYLLLGKKATFEKINNIVDQVISKLKEKDRIIFYFAGHGRSFYGTPYLSCYDSTNSNDRWNNLVDIIGKIEEKAKSKILFFIDACESTINYGLRGENIKISMDKFKEDIKYTYIFSSANYNQNARPNSGTKHGVWTTYLLKALSGTEGIALNGERLTNVSLQNYLSKELKQYCEQKNIEREKWQTPYSWGKSEQEFDIYDFECSGQNTVKIKDLYFGIIDADNELKKDKEKFIENFYDLNGVKEKILRDRNIQMVLGKKGTGKTYIGKYIEQENKKQVKYIYFERFNYKDFNALASGKQAGYERYIIPWKFVLLTYLLNGIANQEKEKFKDIKTLLRKIFGFNIDLPAIINSKFKKNIIIEGTYNEYLAKEDNRFNMKENVQLFSCLIQELDDIKHYLILDGLDEKINEHPNYKEILNGLVWAVKHLNDEFYEKGIDNKIIIFLRKDVFDLIQGANLNKMDAGGSVNLKWTNESEDKYSFPLYEFVNLRIINSLKSKEECKGGITLKDILPKYVKQIDSWEWILNFTTYKPRDIIAFLTECQRLCNKGEVVLTEEIIWNATKGYSEYFYKEFRDEMYGMFSNDQIQDILDGALPKMKMNWVRYERIKEYINQYETLRCLDIDFIIQKLYEIGVIGVKLENEHEHWSYRTKAVSKTVLSNCKYKLHQGLWKMMSIW